MANPYEKAKVADKVKAQYTDADGKLNPKIAGTKERRFDKKGSINAWDRKDALMAIANMLNDDTLHKMKKTSSYRKEAELDPQARREVLLAAMTDASGVGMSKLGANLLAPIKEVIDYEGWARKILRIKDLGQGEVHRITKDVKVVAFLVGQDGQSLMSQAYGKYIFPPEFKIEAFPTVDIQDIYQMNFDVLEREQDLAKQMIMLKEDRGLVTALDAAATAINDLVYFSTFNIGAFEDIKYQVEKHRLVCDKFLINRQELSGLIKNMHSYVDPVTERELILMGYIGTVLNSQIVTTAGTGTQEVITPGNVYAVTEGNFLGEMGIRLDLLSEPFSRFSLGESVKGWIFLEIIDQAIVNPKAVAKGKKL